MLGEIHVALLKSIIRDIEDVARTPAIALGSNQNSAANPGGGHPQIVEGVRPFSLHLFPSLITYNSFWLYVSLSSVYFSPGIWMGF